MKRYASSCRVAFLTMLTCVPGLAHADLQEAALTRAVAAKEAALDHPDPAHWQDAFDRFLQVDALEPSADVKYELGVAAENLRQDDLAVQYYEQAVGLGLSGPGLAKAIAYVERLEPNMARLEVRGKLGSRLLIRGVSRGTLPLDAPVVVFQGETRVQIVESDPERTHTYTLRPTAGETIRLDVSATEASGSAALPLPRGQTMTAKPERPVWLLGVGAGLVLTNGLMLPLSYSKLETRRSELAHACDVPYRTQDGCEHAKPGKYATAIALASDIAHWKTIRAASWVGLGVGVTASSIAYALWFANRSTESAQSFVAVSPDSHGRGLHVTWSDAF